MRSTERDRELELDLDIEYSDDEGEDVDSAGAFQDLLADRRKLITGVLVVVLLVVGIYVVFPKLVGLDQAVKKLDDASLVWILIAVAFNVAAVAAYVALFRGVLAGTRDDTLQRRLNLRASYQITMAGLAATRIFSAAGAGGILLTYWALRKAGMERRRSACLMVAFLVLTYAVYAGALLIFGILLRTSVLPGDNPGGGVRRVERLRYGVGVGAQPSDRVARFLDSAGITQNATRWRGTGKRAEAIAAQKAEAEAQAAAAAPAAGGAPAGHAAPAPASEPVTADAEATTAVEAPAGAETTAAAEAANAEQAPGEQPDESEPAKPAGDAN